jgi:adenylate cyclase class IV
MRNLEVKVSAQDKQSAIRLLKNLGAEYICTMKQADYYFGVGTNKVKLALR